MKANELNLSEDTNLHLTHLEDLALFQGKQGAEKAIAFLKNLADLAKTSSPKKYNVTLKWDGSPAVFCGTDPSDGKFFVGTKAVFNKGAKLNKSIKDIDINHPDAKEPGDKADLRLKLKKAFIGLSKLGIKNVLQGDLLFTSDSLKTIQYKGQSYVAFKPNTITYAVPSNSNLAQEIQQADVGIVFHTSYSGSSLETMSASFEVDLSALTRTKEVWFDDAYIKDFTGIVNLTTGEYQSISNAINDAEKYIQQSQNIFSFLDASELGKKLKEYIHANHNNMVRAGTIEQDPAKFFDGFAKDYEQRIEKEIAKARESQESLAEKWQMMVMTGKVVDDAKAREKFIQKNIGAYNHNSQYAQEALFEARESTFTTPLTGNFSRGVQNFVNNVPILRQIMPFIQTPTNILRTAFERTPLLNLSSRKQREMLLKGTPEERDA